MVVVMVVELAVVAVVVVVAVAVVVKSGARLGQVRSGCLLVAES